VDVNIFDKREQRPLGLPLATEGTQETCLSDAERRKSQMEFKELFACQKQERDARMQAGI
jgi:hypothetical protein